MEKQEWKPGNMLYPLPAVMVSCADAEGKTNILTVAWTGTVCTNPPMLSISVRPERYSCHMIQETGEFVVNLTTEALVRAADLCGVKSGRDVDKWKEAGLTPVPARRVKAPLIGESPVNLECRVEKELALGSHIMFVARVVSVSVDEAYMDEKGSFHLDLAKPVCYSHGTYFSLGRETGKFGFSVAKKKAGRKHS
ncbi:MAG TPA: flavin reductase family protein [Candidatus Eisenbergiella pullistercoris]|uniref:Flavin reductase family protein n=1 Tax=Candidatus Eisenbergiella pullistercoris TaxID=2838555 RepID=A0A9D1YM55_9FIRM|nr:flavin reductase family protein [Candidatus Eisenbergiella pullistercoris]